ncbi:Holliday junction recognition protein [Molossus nigricans]
MEREASGGDALMRQLRESRHRFQRHMQQLLEKYNQPFEDAPVVQMSTLTYKTAQGLRVWGGRLVKKKNKGQSQGFPVEAVGRKDGDALPAPCAQDLGADSKSSDVDATLYQEDPAAGDITPAVPWSPLKDELRRKYLTQVDTLLQDKGCLEDNGYSDGNDTRVIQVPSLASPRPAHGYCGCVPADSPPEPAASPHPCSSDLALVPTRDNVSLRETSGDSFSSSQSFVAGDICSVTVSDLYEGMLHSMSRLLSAKPSCVISTKTFIVRSRSSRGRRRRQSRLNRTYSRGGGPAPGGPQDRLLPCAQPTTEVRVLRERQNVVDLSGQQAGFKLEKAFLEANKLQIWKEPKGTPQKLPSLMFVDSRAARGLDREDRLMALKWLISPVKIVSRPRMLQGEGGSPHQEFRSRFDKLRQEYCLSPSKQPALTYVPSSSTSVVLHGGGPVSPGGPRGLETHRPSRPSSRSKAKSLNEAFKHLGRQAGEAGRCLSKSDSSPSLSRSPGPSEPAAGLFQGNRRGIFRMSVSLSKAISVPGVRPLGSARDRYDGIKEKFDQLHQKYCQKSLQRPKALFCPGESPGKGSVRVQNQKEDFLGKLNPDSGFQRPQKLTSSPQRGIRRSLGSTTMEVHRSPWLALAAKLSPQPHAKRRRLSDPQVCGRWAESQDPSRLLGRAIPRPGEEVSSLRPDWKRKRKEEHIFQDGS